MASKRKSGAAPSDPRNRPVIEAIKTGRFAEAERLCDQGLAARPADRQLLKLRAVIAFRLGQFQRLLDSYLPKAQAANPKDPDVWKIGGAAAARTGDNTKAVHFYRRSLELLPGDLAVLNNLANLLSAAGNSRGAVAALETAEKLAPNDPTIPYTLGNTHFRLDDLDASIRCYERALKLKPDFGEALSSLVHMLAHAARWPTLADHSRRLDDMLRTRELSEGETIESPLANVTRCDELALNQRVAVAECRRRAKESLRLAAPFVHTRDACPMGPVITIGYVSNVFRTHPTTQLMGGLFALHDRSRFRVHAYSFGYDDKSAARERIKTSVDRFVDLKDLDTLTAARAIHDDKPDILVELDGHIRGERLDIMALKPAPVSACYLGFPGSVGADFIDYLIVDKVVAPPEHAEFYVEKLVHLPHSYQCNDRDQAVSTRAIGRAEFGLREDALVLCSFNQAMKLEPVMFDLWMRLLKALPEAVLWLWRNNADAEPNLRREAAARGIGPERIVFAGTLPRPEHLARLRLADLALDTRICNGHTTTSDALFSDLPVITLLGRHFASRVSASLLTAIGVPELITTSLEDYEALALRLGRDKNAREAIAERIRLNRATMPLFDTARFTRNLERAFEEMVNIWQRGEPPRMIEVVDAQGTGG